MKTKEFIGAITFFSLLLCTTAADAQNRQVVGSNKYITKEIKLDDFDEIKLVGSPTVIYTQATNGKSQLKYSGSDNLFDCLEYKVVHHILEISFKNNTNIRFNADSRMEIVVSSPSLEAASLQGSGDIILNGTVKATNLDLVLVGSGDITANDLVCDKEFTAKLQGSGDLTVKGSVRAMKTNLFLVGSGDLDVSNLTTKMAVAKLQGSGDLRVKGMNETNMAVIDLIGSGDLSFDGITAHSVTASVQGSGDMVLYGTTKRADLTMSQSGSLNAVKLKATDVKATLIGSGDISCYVGKSLWSDIQGSGSVGYKGSPSKIVSMTKEKPRKL